MYPATWKSGNRIFSVQVSDRGVAELCEDYENMSSLSRRACYKCGNVGHYAGRSERLVARRKD